MLTRIGLWFLRQHWNPSARLGGRKTTRLKISKKLEKNFIWRVFFYSALYHRVKMIFSLLCVYIHWCQSVAADARILLVPTSPHARKHKTRVPWARGHSCTLPMPTCGYVRGPSFRGLFKNAFSTKDILLRLSAGMGLHPESRSSVLFHYVLDQAKRDVASKYSLYLSVWLSVCLSAANLVTMSR